MRISRIITNDQRGMISFMVTTVLVLVLGLILIGFSQSARRNQRETLDRQLSTQAFYAAESGVNAAASIINRTMANGGEIQPKTTCASDANYPEVQLADNVAVTCLLVDSSLSALYYSNVTETDGTVAPVIATDSAASIATITLRWQAKDGDNTPGDGCETNASTLALPAKSAWPIGCDFGLLRTDVTQFSPGNDTQYAMTQFFKPIYTSTAQSAPNYAPGGGGISAARCQGTSCSASISVSGGSSYYLRLRSIYKDASVTVAALDGSGNTVELKGQAMIDVTAKAQDVLRRIQVRIPLLGDGNTSVPVFALESTGSICKRFTVAPDYYDADATIVCN